MNHDLYNNFVENKEISVTIMAIVIVPNKIITAICFPEHSISNRCPHVTLMINEWKPIMSNVLLEECCIKGTKSPFNDAYEELRHNGKVKEGQEILNGQAKIEKNSVTSSCYFVALSEPITFHGITKIYY